MTEIEIRDPDPSEPEQGPPSKAGTAGEAGAPESPYKNLLVPLVVVPALIVMVLVLVFVLFGTIAGKESSPRENLEKLLAGGANERQQAAFSLVGQVLNSRQAEAAGGAPTWDIDPSFLPDVRAARAQIGHLERPEDVPIPLVLSSLLAQLGDPEGVVQLAEMTALSDELDPEGKHRMYAAWTLGALGPELGEAERERAASTLIGLLDSADPGLVLVAVAGLQNLPSPATSAALQRMLASGVLEQRASAALSLAHLGDPAGATVLKEMLGPEAYAAERALDERKWPAARVSESRRKALQALIDLACAPSASDLRRLAEEDPDPLLRAAAREELARTGG